MRWAEEEKLAMGRARVERMLARLAAHASSLKRERLETVPQAG